ncbi:TetR/AcrR family transcriptional regulator [Streptomyces mirabilis]|uniref:TetR/AcrR family transcriptional regulator n=1 Tax=Streptomyces mirabilis TaxID=68239 RepID=UPI00366A2A4C
MAKRELTARARRREAALELFAEHGFAAPSTRSVAAAADLSPALVTRHCGSKQGLRAAVDEYVLDRIGEQLRDLDSVEPSGGLMVSLGEVPARVFGADPVLRGYLRHVLLEDSAASAELFGRLLSGARAEVERLSEVHGEQAPDEEWAPFQMLCLILGPLLLERVKLPNLDELMLGPEALARRSAADQQLLLRGYYSLPRCGSLPGFRRVL